MLILVFSRLFQVIFPGYSRLFQVIPAYSAFYYIPIKVLFNINVSINKYLKSHHIQYIIVLLFWKYLIAVTAFLVILRITLVSNKALRDKDFL